MNKEQSGTRYPPDQSQARSARPLQQDISSHQRLSLLRSCIAMDHWRRSFRWTEIPPSLPGGVYLPTIKSLVLLNHLHSNEGEDTWRKQGENICPCITLLASVWAWQMGASVGSLKGVDEGCGQTDVYLCRYNGHEFLEGDKDYLHLLNPHCW